MTLSFMNLFFFFYRENFHFYQKQKQLPDSGVKSEARSLQTQKRREKLAGYHVPHTQVLHYTCLDK